MSLGVGKYHLQVPKDRIKNLRFRKVILEAAAKDKRLQRGLVEMCRQDILFFINLFCFQFNPELLGDEIGPFITWDFQDEAILGNGHAEKRKYGLLECVEDRKDARWQKSREVGASWLVLITMVWLCMFHENKSCGCMSQDEDKVDKGEGDPGSLFWKIRFITKHLPNWLTGEVKSKKLNIIYRRSNSFITGEANAISSFVSNRLSMLLVDEFGLFRNGEDTYSLTADVSHCRVFVFTHRDTVSMAYTLCYDIKYKSQREIITHWSQHPYKKKGLYRVLDNGKVERLDPRYEYAPEFQFELNGKPHGGPFPGIRSPWYDEECVRRGDERAVAMHLDIDPRGATEQFFDSFRIKSLIRTHCVAPSWTGELRYDKETGEPHELMKGDGKLKLWVTPKSPTELPTMKVGSAVDVSQGSGETPSCFVGFNSLTGQKVFEYCDAHILPTEFAVLCVAVCRLCKDAEGNTAILAWEKQGSAAFQTKVIDRLGYRRCMMRQEEDTISKAIDTKGRYGWNVTTDSIERLYADYRDALYTQECVNMSEHALDETLQIVYEGKSIVYKGKGKKAAGDRSGANFFHGDIVRADALAWRVVKDVVRRKIVAKQQEEWLDPRTWDGRRRISEMERAKREEEEVWA